MLAISKLIVILAMGFYWKEPFDPTYTDAFNLYTNAMLTTGLVLLTAASVVDTQGILKQSKNDQRIRYLEKSLESFYIPVQDILIDQRYIIPRISDPLILSFWQKGLVAKYNDNMDVLYEWAKDPKSIVYYAQADELKKYSCYRYLAQDRAYSSFIDLTTSNDIIYFKVLPEYLKNLAEYVKTDIENYQKELDQLTKNPNLSK
jgi:hypothetical protein